jgi:hypothetical protein
MTSTSAVPTAHRSRVRRLSRAAAAIAGLAGAAVIALPGAAFANYGWGGTLSPGSTACVGQQANYQVRGEGNSYGPVKYTLYRDGVLVATSGGVTAYAVERRSSLGNFPGPGFYTLCGKNNQGSGILTNIRILVDGDF